MTDSQGTAYYATMWEKRGWKRGVGLVMDDPFFWIKGCTEWMTFA